jgi:rubrerythrin
VEYKIAKDPDALLGALAEHERAIARLYQAYSSRFDEYGIFWGDLAQEELKHAACLNKLRTLLKEDPAIVIVERFSVDAIRFSIDYVNELIGRASQPNFELINALSLAKKLEESLLEKNFFEALSGDSQETREALEFLANETERHFKILCNIQEERKGRTY